MLEGMFAGHSIRVARERATGRRIGQKDMQSASGAAVNGAKCPMSERKKLCPALLRTTAPWWRFKL